MQKMPVSARPEKRHSKLGGKEGIFLLAVSICFDICKGRAERTSLRYSPTSPWRKATTAVGSSFLASAVERAVTPNPRGVSSIDRITTPECSGQSSLQRPTCALTTLPPYRNGISPLALTHNLYRACGAITSSAVICILNLPVFVNFPMQVPRHRRLSRATDVARFARDRRT